MASLQLQPLPVLPNLGVHLDLSVLLSSHRAFLVFGWWPRTNDTTVGILLCKHYSQIIKHPWLSCSRVLNQEDSYCSTGADWVGAALPVEILYIQNLGVLRDKTCGWISLTDSFNERKTAAKSWDSISSAVDRAPGPEDKRGPQGSAAFPKPQGTHCMGHIKHQSAAKSLPALALNPLAPSTPYPPGQYLLPLL